MLFCKGRPLLKKNRKDCEGRPYAKICKRQILLFLRGATLRLYCKGQPYADLARGDPTLILQEATPAAVVLTILLILSLFFLSPVGRPFSRLSDESHDGGCRNLRVRARKL